MTQENSSISLEPFSEDSDNIDESFFNHKGLLSTDMATDLADLATDIEPVEPVVKIYTSKSPESEKLLYFPTIGAVTREDSKWGDQIIGQDILLSSYAPAAPIRIADPPIAEDSEHMDESFFNRKGLYGLPTDIELDRMVEIYLPNSLESEKIEVPTIGAVTIKQSKLGDQITGQDILLSSYPPAAPKRIADDIESNAEDEEEEGIYEHSCSKPIPEHNYSLPTIDETDIQAVEIIITYPVDFSSNGANSGKGLPANGEGKESLAFSPTNAQPLKSKATRKLRKRTHVKVDLESKSEIIPRRSKRSKAISEEERYERKRLQNLDCAKRARDKKRIGKKTHISEFNHLQAANIELKKRYNTLLIERDKIMNMAPKKCSDRFEKMLKLL